MSERTRQLPRRSCLSVPASSDKMIAKAPGLGADMVFLDLEDSVAPLEKDSARASAVRAVGELDWGDAILGVRVNAWDSRWTYRDVVDLVEQAGERLDVIMLPKAENAGHVAALDLLVSQVERAAGREHALGFEVQIESARGLLHVEDICTASSRLEAIVFGPADFAASMEMPMLTAGVELAGYPGDHFHYVFEKMLVAGRASGVQVIDGPFLKIHELDALRDYATRTMLLGFDGKWALHPGQVPVINEVFTPAREQFDRACDILDAYERATSGSERRGAVMFGDEMIDEASAKMATKLAARGRRAGMEHRPEP